uniref:Uncharacterized protein n=1 Tax=Anguilla anguilla TaxID=7936 RepID=A0A0E9U8B2_ANGAN
MANSEINLHKHNFLKKK